MIMFLAVVAALSVFFAGLLHFVRKKIVSIYRGGVFILLSGLYFSAVFATAYFLRESFK